MKSMSVSKEVKDKLDEVRHPGQSYDGIIRELIQRVERAEALLSQKGDRQ